MIQIDPQVREKVAQALYEAVRPYWKEQDGFESDPWDKPAENDETHRDMWRVLADASIIAFLDAWNA